MSDADRVRGMIAMCDGLARMSSDNGPVREEWVATSAALTALLDDARRTREALHAARTFIGGFRVPQDMMQAALQIGRGKRILDRIDAALGDKP